MKVLDKNRDLGLLVLRLAVGILMLFHGIGKLIHGIDPIEQMVVGAGMPAFVAYGVFIGEIVAPLLIVLGLATRLGALMFAVNCLFAVFMAHPDQLLTITEHGGWALELLGLYFFASVALFFTGGGQYALSDRHLWD